MGRTKQYDENEVLEKAMWAFWKNGYEQTSVRHLEEHMGINQFSMYASFKSKQHLFHRCLAKYQDFLNQRYLTELNRPDATIKQIQAFLQLFARDISTGILPNGCMMVNATAEAPYDNEIIRKTVLDFFTEMKKKFQQALANSQDKGIIGQSKNVGQLAEYLVGIAQSISIYAKVNSAKNTSRYLEYVMQSITQ